MDATNGPWSFGRKQVEHGVLTARGGHRQDRRGSLVEEADAYRIETETCLCPVGMDLLSPGRSTSMLQLACPRSKRTAVPGVKLPTAAGGNRLTNRYFPPSCRKAATASCSAFPVGSPRYRTKTRASGAPKPPPAFPYWTWKTGMFAGPQRTVTPLGSEHSRARSWLNHLRTAAAAVPVASSLLCCAWAAQGSRADENTRSDARQAVRKSRAPKNNIAGSMVTRLRRTIRSLTMRAAVWSDARPPKGNILSWDICQRVSLASARISPSTCPGRFARHVQLRFVPCWFRHGRKPG